MSMPRPRPARTGILESPIFLTAAHNCFVTSGSDGGAGLHVHRGFFEGVEAFVTTLEMSR